MDIQSRKYVQILFQISLPRETNLFNYCVAKRSPLSATSSVSITPRHEKDIVVRILRTTNTIITHRHQLDGIHMYPIQGMGS